ncbi:MAG: RnfABCDGE type electron transport complex subunit D [candidate division KSB1 bacterium]|nr:RnfABCDGE type electron transport complex subunit D [candidate division KSB1 bacterium]
MDKKLQVTSSPHLNSGESVAKIMWSVVLALLPAAAGAVYFFGVRAFWIMAIAVISAVVTEAILQKLLKKPIAVADGSAVVTGILLAFNVPVQTPLWIPAIGSFFAIAVGKMAFGGLGHNPMNPALLGRAFLLASWPTHMTIFDRSAPLGGTVSGIDVMTGATPLNVLKSCRAVLAHPEAYTPEQKTAAAETLGKLYDSLDKLFIGRVGGCIGETSVLLLLAGAAFLMYRRYIGWKIPFSYIGTVALLTWMFGGAEGLFTGNPLFHVLSGGLILGAFFMATDMVTSPVTFAGRIYFGIGCGVITVIIRLIGGYPEGVSYSILLMNLVTPLLDRMTRPKVFGGRKER